MAYAYGGFAIANAATAVSAGVTPDTISYAVLEDTLQLQLLENHENAACCKPVSCVWPRGAKRHAVTPASHGQIKCWLKQHMPVSLRNFSKGCLSTCGCSNALALPVTQG